MDAPGVASARVSEPRLSRKLAAILDVPSVDLRTPPPGCRFHPRCPLAMDVCREEIPPEVRYPDGIRVACHLYPPGGDGARRPIPILEVTGADASVRPVPAVGLAPAGERTP